MKVSTQVIAALAALCVAVGACDSAPTGPPAPAAPQVELIPRTLLFGNPVRTYFKISPDGRHVTFLAPKDDVLNVWVAPAGDLEAARPLTDATGRSVKSHAWAHNGTHVLYLQDTGGDEDFHIYSVSLETGVSQDLTPFPKTHAKFIGASHRHPDDYLIGLNNRDQRWHDVWRINVVTGARTLLETNTGFASYLADERLAVRLASKPTADGGAEIFKKGADGDWVPFFTIPKDDMMTFHWLCFSGDGTTFYALDSRERDTTALVAIDFETGERTVLASDPRADIKEVLFHPVENRPLAYSVYYDKAHWHVLDPSVRATFQQLTAAFKGNISIIGQTEDNAAWIVGNNQATNPYTYYILDRTSGSLEELAVSRPDLADQPLVEMHAVTITARDGLTLPSYLSLPMGSDPDGDGRPDEPLPTVLIVHGGPWARHYYTYSAQAQWMANRGYAVLSVNFRGSTGFGKAFINAADMEWGGKMQDDLIDGVRWAIAEGIARPDKVAIMGGSYGGYATLAGLAFTPDVFACGVSVVGPSNLVTLLNSIPPYWAAYFESLAKRVGDPRTDAGLLHLKARSPLFKADQIEKPLLIGHGANDPRVKQSESDQIVSALKKNGLPVTYVLFPDEGHGFARSPNRLAFYAITEAFITRCLGGRSEPIGNALQASSARIKAGAEHIPGLPDAMTSRMPH